MKKLSILIAIAVLVAGFVSCGKDDNNNSNIPENSDRLRTITEFQDWDTASITTCEYDNARRLVKHTVSIGNLITLFKYETGKVIQLSYPFIGAPDTITYLLNSNGLATSGVASYKKAETPVSRLSFYKSSTQANTHTYYIYDNNNYMIKEMRQFGGGTDTTKYVITNGNCTYIQYGSMNPFSISMQFLPDKTNTTGMESMGISFWGKQDKNPYDKKTYHDLTGLPTMTIDYAYEYDSKNRISKRYRVSDPSYYTVYTYVD